MTCARSNEPALSKFRPQISSASRARISSRLRLPSLLLVVVVAIQIAVGVANVLLRLPIEVTLLHSAGAAAIGLLTAWTNDEAWRAPLAAASSFRAVEAK